MAITKETVIDKIEVVGDYKDVQVRTATVIKEDGKELSRSFHRHALTLDADITNEDAEVQAVCNAVWTQDVKDAYATFKASQDAELGVN
jgi:phage host-nuclease inhibitor protein Gam